MGQGPSLPLFNKIWTKGSRQKQLWRPGGGGLMARRRNVGWPVWSVWVPPRGQAPVPNQHRYPGAPTLEEPERDPCRQEGPGQETVDGRVSWFQV